MKAGYAESTAKGKSWAWVGKSRDDRPKDKQHVWDAVQATMKARSERTQIDAGWLLLRLVSIGKYVNVQAFRANLITVAISPLMAMLNSPPRSGSESEQPQGLC